MKNKRLSFTLLIAIIAVVVLLAGCGQSNSKEVRIGYQKGAVPLLLKDSKAFAEELKELGYKVTWSEFNTGSSIIEALNAGSIDFANAGDLPALFALSKGSNFAIIASEPNAPGTEGILVRSDSGIESLEDLKGKKIAYNNASIAQYLTVKALQSADLAIEDVESVILGPSDASIAFEKGDIDAWTVWDPYMTVAENQGHKILTTAEGIVSYRYFYLSRQELIDSDPKVVELYIKHIREIGHEINKDATTAAALMEEVTKVPADTWKIALGRAVLDTQYVDEAAIADLRIQAQDLLDLGLIEQAIDLDGKIYTPKND